MNNNAPNDELDGVYRTSRNLGEINIWRFKHQLHLVGITFDKMHVYSHMPL